MFAWCFTWNTQVALHAAERWPDHLSDPREILESGLAELRLPASDAMREQLVRLAELLESWNARINLSGHRSAGSIAGRLILDALALSQQLPAPLTSLADLGSGAGFPGLPIAVIRPEARVTLVESRERRHHFQRAAIRELGLTSVRALRGRIETLAAEPAQVVVAQAVSPPAKVLEAMLRWVEPGGFVVIPGSEQPPRPGEHPRIRSSEVRRYRTPCGGPLRTLWIGQSE